MAASEKTQKAINHLKSHQTLYTFLTMLSALLGIYLDYRAGIADLEKKSSASESEQVEQDLSLQKNLQFVYEQNMKVESRLTRLEVEMEGVKESNKSILSYFFNGGLSTPIGHSGDGIPDPIDIHHVEPRPSGVGGGDDAGAWGEPDYAADEKGEEERPDPFKHLGEIEEGVQKKLDLSPPERHFP